MPLRFSVFLLALAALLTLAPAASAQVVSLPVTFEDAINYELTDFGGAEQSMVVADPTDATNMVVQTVRPATAECFAGTTVADATGFTERIPFTADAKTMSVRVWSPEAGVLVLFKVEEVGNPGLNVETYSYTTVAGGWETMVFDFGDPKPNTNPVQVGGNYNKASIFFDFQCGNVPPTTLPAATRTYYWDDVQFGGVASGGGITLPVTFEEDIDYELRDFEGTTTTVVADPTDGTNTVAETVRGAGAATFAGTVIADVTGLASPIPFAAGATTMSLRVWSPDAGTPVRLKIEQVSGGAFSETETLTTVAMAWETLVFDFASPVAGSPPVDLGQAYDKLVVFFNFGFADSPAAQTYYWDDLAFGGATGGGGITLPVTFEEDIDYELRDFEGTTTTVVADPTDGTNTVAETVRGAGAATFAGTVIADVTGLASPIPFAAGATTMSLRVWSPDAGTPVRLKIEQVSGGAFSETETLTTVAMAWETLVFDFASPVAGSPPVDLGQAYDKLVVFFNFGFADSPAAQTYYWDDLAFGGATGGGGITLPVTFEEDIDYELRDFEGTTTTVVADPTDGTNTVAETVRGAGAATFAGTVVADVTGLASPVPFTAEATTMSLRVWSPRADVPVRLKVEKVGGGAFSETETLTTVAMAWETLVFDFAAPVAGSPPVNPAETYDKLVVFFDFGRADSPAAETFYWDDLSFGGEVVDPPDPSVSLPITFEEDINYELTDFGGAEQSMVVADPTDATNMVVQTVRPATAECFAGTTVADATGFTERIPFTADAKTMSVRVWSPEAGVLVLFKVEEVGNPGLNVETYSYTTVAGGWETMVFDFGDPKPNTNPVQVGGNYNKASIFFDFQCGNVPPSTLPAATRTYYWDDVEFGPGAVAAEGSASGFDVAPSVFPNPARGAASISFALASASNVTVEVFDALGRRVAVAFEGALAAGEARIAVPTGGLAAGVNLIRVRTEAGVATTTLTVVR